MPTITKEAERALMEISRQKSERIAKLERALANVDETARFAIADGIKNGAVLWREALERIVRISAQR